ncbi:MAG TPA: hypothetical protein VFS43_34360 [Polyangiaceae bacterium]|nr:hypothetical protein [Polyangiaceae bacterium]
MRGTSRGAKAVVTGGLAGALAIAACSLPDGAIRYCEPGTVADQAAGECVTPTAGAGGQGGSAGASGGAGTGGAAGACEPERLATDAKNCGACGRDCRGAPCENGACQPELLADRLTGPYGLVVADAGLLWASPARDAKGDVAAPLLSLPRSAPQGALPSPLFGGSALRARGVALAPGGELVWGDLDGATISRRSPGAAQATALATGRPDVTRVVVAGEHVYWTQGALDATRAEGGVYRAPLGGGPAEELAGAQLRPDALAVDGATAYWVNRGPDGQVMRARAGAAPEIVERAGDPIAVAAGGGRLAWAERSSGRVALLAEGALSATTLVRDATELVEGIALEGDAVYRLAFRPDERRLVVKRSALDGGGEVLLTRIAPADAGYSGNPLGPFVLALDEGYLYIADPGTLTAAAAGGPRSQKNGRMYRTAR